MERGDRKVALLQCFSLLYPNLYPITFMAIIGNINAREL
jgi:hypothetical protein